MEIEIYEALISANVTPEKASAAAHSIQKGIDNRYGEHAKVLFTQGDASAMESRLQMSISEVKSELRTSIADLKTEMIKWVVGAIVGAAGLCVAIVKLVQ